ncbi:hypothetical protein [Amycolatopsis sp. FDAARGOS 1241]|uniref:hypothetical protein n=1 Tax=Amycolatopsis sp. FDAARGOS 1241 TaxID=2778070 RepID=UPI00194E3C52|nr:hypothetical protein [Amycolatopsis sp. FDAARGOS 1241]QRP46042.1 hypothetical protein I6J71_44515 [Amycolatopsis sp. FDAARGOS 1241]
MNTHAYGPGEHDEDIEVVVIDPANVMPADVALCNYITAETAVEDFERVLAETGDVARARAEVDRAHPNELELVKATIELYAQLRIAGRSDEEARSEAARDVADRMTPRLSAEQVAAAFAAPAVGEGDVDDADWRWNPPASSLVPEREPEPDGWIARNLPATPDLVVPDEYEPDYLTAEEDELEQLAFDNGEEGTSPYTGMAAPMVVNQSGVLRNWASESEAVDITGMVDDGDDDVSWPMLRSTDPTVAEFRETDVPAVQLLLDADTTAAESGIANSDTAELLDRIDDVLAAPEPTPLAAVVERCGQAVDEASDALHRAEVTGEDAQRADRLSRWNADDQASPRTDDRSEGWEPR